MVLICLVELLTVPAKNIIILGLNQRVEINFGFDLNTYTDISVEIGDETYTLSSNPSNVIVEDSVLKIDIGTVTSLSVGSYPIKIMGYTASQPSGEVLTSPQYNPLCRVKVIEQSA